MPGRSAMHANMTVHVHAASCCDQSCPCPARHVTLKTCDLSSAILETGLHAMTVPSLLGAPRHTSSYLQCPEEMCNMLV